MSGRSGRMGEVGRVQAGAGEGLTLQWGRRGNSCQMLTKIPLATWPVLVEEQWGYRWGLMDD